jgi:regulator of protease activity HflC (stomatin/prohibitin superfamily)
MEFLIVLGTVAFLAVLTVVAGIKTVPQGQQWTVERFGRYTGLLYPGLNLIVPFIDQIGRKINVQEQVLDIPEQDVITQDNAVVLADGIVYYRIFNATKAAYEVSDVQAAITSLAMTNLRAVIGGMTLDETLSGRERINAALLQVLDGATESWGVKVTRVELRNIQPPANLVAAMNLQMTAERERRAQIAKAQGDREAQIARAEGQKQAQILEAEGRKEAAFRDAEARERLAEAEARAVRMVADAAAQGGPAAIQYFVADKYVAAFKEMAANPNARLVVVPAELSSLAGLAAAAVEGLRAFQADGGRTAPSPPPAAPGAGPWTRG